jgi:hypothetical protein
MITITIIENSDLGACEATIAEETWKNIVSIKGSSEFAEHGKQVVVGDLFQGPKYLLRIEANGHLPDQLHVSPVVKKTFYSCITSVSINPEQAILLV